MKPCAKHAHKKSRNERLPRTIDFNTKESQFQGGSILGVPPFGAHEGPALRALKGLLALWCFTVTLDPWPFWVYFGFLRKQLNIRFIATLLSAAKLVYPK